MSLYLDNFIMYALCNFLDYEHIVDQLIQYYQKMETQQKIRITLQQAEKIKGKLHFQGQKIYEYMSFQQRKITKSDFFFTGYGICGNKDPEVKQSFKRAFKTLSELQMAEFYLQNYKTIYSILNSKQLENKVKDQAQMKYKATIRMNSKQKKQMSGTIEILESQKILRVIETKIQIDLHDYILRKSKKGKKIDIILESTENPQIGETIRIISFDHEQLLKITKKLWQDAQYQNIKQMILTDKSFKDLRKNKKNSLMPKTSFIESITSTIIQKNIQLKEVENQNSNNQGQINEIIKTFANFDKFQHIKFGQYFQKSGFRVRKILQLNSTEQEDIQYYEKLIKYLFLKNSTQNEEHKSPISEVYKKIIELEKELFQLNFRIQTLTIHGSKYLIIQSIQSQQLSEEVEAFSHAKIHHCIWRVRQISHKIEIFVEAKIQYCKSDKSFKKAHKYSSLFLGNLIDVIISKQIKKFTEDILSNQFNSHPGSQINDDDEFKTISGSFIYDEETGRARLNSVMGNRQRLLSFSITKTSDSAIKHKYITTPRQKKEKRCFRTPKGHWCWQDEWQLRQNGDIVNINKQKISAQSSVLQFILKRMGRNIFSGKSIMNISLPVSIFGKETNVQRLAKGYHFAPTFLEIAAKQTDPIQRMKLVMCFGLGFSLNYIQMDKPFNPILGQTYQAIVDGCPIYGQQISHHPPISSLYMVGRGYTLYGSFQAKIQFGLNSAAGSNQGFNHVQFQDDQSVVKISTPPGEMSGLIYGQRKVAVIRKTYCIDQKNHLLCQISWGRNKTSQNEQAKYNDFFCGKIVKVKSQVSLANFKNIKTNQIQKEFGMITGRLTKNIFYNGELILDVNTEQPHLIQYYSPCLQSDARFRQDLIYRKQDKVAASQQAKQELEQLQRRDRKLRNEYHPQAH